MPQKNKRQLVLSVTPDRALCPEWEDLRGDISPAQMKVKTHIHQIMVDEPDTWLFTLGIQNFDHGFSASLEYFISFGNTFIKRLLKTAELERFREKTQVAIPKDLVEKYVQQRPAMTGSEYITSGMLEKLWQDINRGIYQGVRQ